MHCLIGLASSLGPAEQRHSLAKEDRLWPTCAHNRKLHFSWKVHKAKFHCFVWAGEIVLVQIKAESWSLCHIMLEIIPGTITVSGRLENAREIKSSNLVALIMFVWEWNHNGSLVGCLLSWSFALTRGQLFAAIFLLVTFPMPFS